jgi:hypothetical protein
MSLAEVGQCHGKMNPAPSSAALNPTHPQHRTWFFLHDCLLATIDCGYQGPVCFWTSPHTVHKISFWRMADLNVEASKILEDKENAFMNLESTDFLRRHPKRKVLIKCTKLSLRTFHRKTLWASLHAQLDLMVFIHHRFSRQQCLLGGEFSVIMSKVYSMSLKRMSQVI